MMNLSEADVVIRREARRWVRFIRQNTYQYKPYWAYEDLVQEGWIAALKAYKDFDETRGATFVVFLWQAVRFRFQNIYHKKIKRDMARTYCHLPLLVDDQNRGDAMLDDESTGSGYSFAMAVGPKQEYTPEDYAALADLLDEVSDSSKGLVRMIVDGVPEKLLIMLRRKMRHNKLIKHMDALDGDICPDNKTIENFFHVKLDKIRPKGL